MRHRITGGVMALSALATPLASADNLDPAAIVVLDPIVVEDDAITPTTQLIFSEQLNPTVDTADALKNLNGVSGSRIGGHGTDPSIRGLSQNRINVLIDGAYIYGGCPNRMDPPTAYAGDFDEVTLIRGVESLQWGSGSGSSLLFTRNTEPFNPDGEIRAQLTAGLRDNPQSWNSSLDLQAGNALGFLRLQGSRGSAEDYQDGNNNDARSAYRHSSGGLLMGFNSSDSSQLELSIDHQQTRDLLYAGAGMDSPISDSDAYRLRWQEKESFGPFDDVNLELYRTEVDHVMDNYTLRTPGMMKMRAPSRSDTQGGRLIAGLGQDDQRWKFGLEVQSNLRDANRYNDSMAGALNSVLWPGAEIKQSSVFAELNQSLNADDRLISGLRLDMTRSDASRADIDPPMALMSPNQLYALYYDGAQAERRDEEYLGGLLRFEHALDEQGSLAYASLSRTIRVADATERFIASNSSTASDRWVGNPTLEDEKHHQLEAGVVRYIEDWQWQGSLYLNQVEDYILRDRYNEVNNYATIYRNVNARLIGGEFSLSQMLSAHWLWQLDLAYVHATNLTDDRPIAQTPPLEASLQLRYQQDAMEASATLRGAASQTRVDTLSSTGIDDQGLDLGETAGWAVVDLAATFYLDEQVTLRAGIDNLLDKTYALHLNRANAFDPTQIQVNEPGRSAWLSLTMNF